MFFSKLVEGKTIAFIKIKNYSSGHDCTKKSKAFTQLRKQFPKMNDLFTVSLDYTIYHNWVIYKSTEASGPRKKSAHQS